MTKLPHDVALRADDGKPPLHLIAPDLLEALGRVLAFGEKKYAAWNWMRGKEWSRDYAATLRHLNAWWGGEDLDPESGLPHLAHAACDLMFLLVSQRRALGVDDRCKLVEPQVPVTATEADLDALREKLENDLHVQYDSDADEWKISAEYVKPAKKRRKKRRS